MRSNTGYQPAWGRALGALLAFVVVLAVYRGVWEVVLGAAVVALLVGSYLIRRQARRRAVYDHRSG